MDNSKKDTIIWKAWTESNRTKGNIDEKQKRPSEFASPNLGYIAQVGVCQFKKESNKDIATQP